MKHVLTIAVLGLSLSTPALAIPITVPGAGTWIAAAAPNEDGTPFWDHTSFDGPNQNIGFKLQSLLGLQYSNLEYLDATSFIVGATGQNVELKVEVAGQAGNNELYYNNGTDQLIFSGAASPGATFAGPITGPFSFVFYSNGNPANAWSSSSASWYQQFALFHLKGTEQYFLGIEDLPRGGDWDYNDMIVSFQLQPATVPEPGMLLLFGTALAGIAAGLRRRARQ